MDFIDEVRSRSSRFAKRIAQMDNSESTEEATKTSLVLPFIQMLGYDIFDPVEVVPEFTADIGSKKGEKVDYALIQSGMPAILVECKKLGTKLDDDVVSQLLRYFGVTASRVGILTDGIRYLFFSDLDQLNVMDPRPFFIFDMLNFTEQEVQELKRFTKEAFDQTTIIDAARELRYTAEIKRLLARELAKPSDDFVRFVTRQVYKGTNSVGARLMFQGLTYSAFNQFISDKIQDRLANALKQEGDAPSSHVAEEQAGKDEPPFVATEIEVLNVIKAILGGLVDVRRLDLRQTKRYCSVVLHDSPEREDYGGVLFQLYARRPESVRLVATGMTPIHVEQIYDLYAHTDALRQFVSGNCINARPESPDAAASSR